MVALRTRASGSTTATVAIAWLSVHSRSLAPESSRARMPVTTTSKAAMPAITPKMPNFRRETGEPCSVGMRNLRCGGVFGALLFVYHTKHHGNEHQCRNRCKNQSTDHGAAERRVLLAALAEAQCHRRHADDHRQCRHQHRAEPDETGLQGGRNGIAELRIALAGEGDH